MRNENWRNGRHHLQTWNCWCRKITILIKIGAVCFDRQRNPENSTRTLFCIENLWGWILDLSLKKNNTLSPILSDKNYWLHFTFWETVIFKDGLWYILYHWKKSLRGTKGFAVVKLPREMNWAYTIFRVAKFNYYNSLDNTLEYNTPSALGLAAGLPLPSLGFYHVSTVQCFCNIFIMHTNKNKNESK